MKVNPHTIPNKRINSRKMCTLLRCSHLNPDPCHLEAFLYVVSHSCLWCQHAFARMFVRWEIRVVFKLEDLGYAEANVGISEMKNVSVRSWFYECHV